MTPNFIGQNNRSRLRGPSSYIDWTPFLEHGNCLVNILLFLLDDVVGKEATSVLQMRRNVKVILKEKKLTAKGIYGIFQRSS
jgi:5-methyltetrahydrofolate--homocysteine methyltransferase